MSMSHCAASVLLHCSCCFQEPEQGQQLSQSAEGQQMLAVWKPHLSLLGVHQPVLSTAHASTPAAVGEADSVSANQALGSAAGSTAAALAQPGVGPAHTPAAQGCAELASTCDGSSKSSSATNSPRSSMSSYVGASVSTSTFSSTVVGSPAGCCPTNWALSRSSSCCDCDSQHSTSAGIATASSSRTPVVGEEQQREALAALVTSARAHLAKQQLLVSHLARRSGLLYRLCEEVLVFRGSSTGSRPASAGAGGLCAGSSQDAARARQERLQQVRQPGRLVVVGSVMSSSHIPCMRVASSLHWVDHLRLV